MSIYVNKDSKVLVQGITGSVGSFHTKEMISYGTNIVGGVTPGKGGLFIEGVPVFNSVKDALGYSEIDVSVIFVPPHLAADAIIESVDAEIGLVICISEGIPVLDMVKVKDYMRDKNTQLIGPNCPGIITSDECKIGIMPGYIHKKGNVGIISRSGTLTYEAVYQLSNLGLGQSTAVGIGGDPINGTNFIDVLKEFNNDEDTHAVILIGEIGGTSEEDAADWIKKNMTKPVIGFIGGKTAPEGRRMGHAGAIVSGGKGTAESKLKSFESAGIYIADTPSSIGEKVLEVLKEKKLI